MEHLKRLKRAKITILAVVLLTCVLCGGMTAGVKSALAPLAGELGAVTWGAEQRPTGITLSVEIEWPWLIQLRPINRLHLSPIDRKW